MKNVIAVLLALCALPVLGQQAYSGTPAPAGVYISSNGNIAGPWNPIQFAAGTQAYSGTPGPVGLYYSSTGNIKGPWYPCTLAVCFGGGGGTVTSVSGTTNQIDVATGTTTPVISFDANALSNLGGLPLTGGTMSGLLNVAWTPSDSNVITANNMQTATFPRTVDEFCSAINTSTNCEKDFGRARSANNAVQMLFGYVGVGSTSNSFTMQFFGGSSVFNVTAAGNMTSLHNTLDNGGNAIFTGQVKAAGYNDTTIGYTASAMSSQSTATPTPITNMGWNLSASKNYTLECDLPITWAATATVAFSLVGPGTPTSYSLTADGALGAAGVFASVGTFAQSSWSVSSGATGAVNGTQVAHVKAGIQNGTTAGSMTLDTIANGTNNITVLANGRCRLTQVN